MERQVQVIAPKTKIKILDDGTTILPTQKRVAAYCRVSTVNEEQKTSYDNQIDEWTKRLTSNPEYHLVGIYADQGISGTSDKRRVEFKRLIQDARAGKIDKIFTKSISRFARNVTLTISLTRELKELGVEVYFDEERLSSLDSQSEFVFTILASMAQEESRHTSENVKWTFEKKMKDGIPFISDSTFLGYVKDPNNKRSLMIVPEEAETVKLIYDLYISGVSVLEICRRLENGKYKTGAGKTKWYPSTVEKILTNEKYCGDLLLQKTITLDYLTHKRVKNTGQAQQYFVKDNHPAIIDREIWDRAQIIFLRNKNKFQGIDENKRKYTSRYPLSGKLICVNCGKSYKRRHWTQGYPTPRIVYQCNGYIQGRPFERCKSSGISEDILLKMVCEIINELIIDKQMLFNTIKGSIKNVVKYEEVDNKIEQLENHLELIDENISVILTQKANTTDNDELFLLDKKYRDKIKEYKLITERIKELSQVAAKTRDTKERIERMSSLLKEGTITPNMLSKELIDSFIFTILVEDKNNVVVVINVSQNDSIKDIIAKRKSIIDFEPIYSSTTHLDRRFRPETINYKIVVI